MGKWAGLGGTFILRSGLPLGKDTVTIKQQESKQVGDGQPDASGAICHDETHLRQRTL